MQICSTCNRTCKLSFVWLQFWDGTTALYWQSWKKMNSLYCALFFTTQSNITKLLFAYSVEQKIIIFRLVCRAFIFWLAVLECWPQIHRQMTRIPLLPHLLAVVMASHLKHQWKRFVNHIKGLIIRFPASISYWLAPFLTPVSVAWSSFEYYYSDYMEFKYIAGLPPALLLRFP